MAINQWLFPQFFDQTLFTILQLVAAAMPTSEYSVVSHQLTDARVRLTPAPAADELLALNKKIADLELQVDDLEQQLEVLREKHLRVWGTRYKTLSDQWYESDAGKAQILRARQDFRNLFREAGIRKSQAAAAAECESWCWQSSSASGSGDRWWAASTWTPSEWQWNTWAGSSWSETPSS
jgi:hypothetical protein